MMKTLVLFVMLTGSFCYGQKVERSVVANGGGYHKGSALSMSYTIGESGVGLAKASSLALLSGYNQPDNLGGIGIAPLNQTSLKVYPNPAQDYLYLEMTGASILDLSILNPQGQVALQQSTLVSGEKLDIGFLSAGVYIISCKVEGKIATMRFVKY